MMRILGVDVSLNACGLCVLPDNWAAGGRFDWSEVKTDTVGRKLSRDAGESLRAGRLDYLAAAVALFARKHDADVAVFEQYAFNRADSNARAIAEAGGCIRLELHRMGIELHVAVASSARKTLLGKLPRGKGVLKPAVQRTLRDMGAPFWQDDNRCDALVVANHYLSVAGFGFVGVAA